MPSFPGAVFNPSARTNGQTIDASHVNDLQDEVVAIETGYLNGTARLNSSNSTLGTLSVSGGSTFAGPVTFSSGVTFADPVTFSTGLTLSTGKIAAGSTGVSLGDSTTPFKDVYCSSLYVNGSPVGGRQPVARVFHSADQQFAAGAIIGLNWDSESVNSTAMHSTSANSSRLLLNSSGVWMVGAYVYFGAAASADDRVVIWVNDSSGIAAGIASSAAGNPTVNVTTLYYTGSTSEFVTARVFSASTNRALASNNSYGGSHFWATKITG